MKFAYIKDLRTGKVWRLFGNEARHMSPAALDLDIYLNALGGTPVKIVEVKDAGTWLKNMLDTGTGKAVAL